MIVARDRQSKQYANVYRKNIILLYDAGALSPAYIYTLSIKK